MGPFIDFDGHAAVQLADFMSFPDVPRATMPPGTCFVTLPYSDRARLLILTGDDGRLWLYEAPGETRFSPYRGALLFAPHAIAAARGPMGSEAGGRWLCWINGNAVRFDASL